MFKQSEPSLRENATENVNGSADETNYNKFLIADKL